MEGFKAVMTFLGQAAWPTAVVIIFLLSQKELRHLLSAIRMRVSDPRQRVNITRQGVSLAAIDAKVEILKEAQQPIAHRLCPHVLDQDCEQNVVLAGHVQ